MIEFGKQKIYYSVDEESIEQLEKAYPGKKVTSVYAS